MRMPALGKGFEESIYNQLRIGFGRKFVRNNFPRKQIDDNAKIKKRFCTRKYVMSLHHTRLGALCVKACFKILFVSKSGCIYLDLGGLREDKRGK